MTYPLIASLSYDHAENVVSFWTTDPNIPTDSPINWLLFPRHDMTPEAVQRTVDALLPTDAVLSGRESSDRSSRLDIFFYYSAALATRYPPLWATMKPWRDKTPGTIVVYRDRDNQTVTLAAAGSETGAEVATPTVTGHN